MKKLITIIAALGSYSVFALPTYEPFSEYQPLIATYGSNSLNLCISGLTAPSGEQWGSLNFSGTSGTGIKGVDVYVTNSTATTSFFTDTALGSLLPSTFPGFPASGNAITNFAVNPAQLVNGNTVGNSAVLKFAHTFTRPGSGTKTLFISYLFSVAQKGQTGTGNVGRYLGFLTSTNLIEGTNTPGAMGYTNWSSLFDTYSNTVVNGSPIGTNGPKYFGHGVFNGAPEFIEPYDSSAGKNPTTPPTTFSVGFNTAAFIVGEFVYTAGGGIKDTNILWVNPATSGFGGPTPPSPGIANPMAITMSDVGGMVLIDRVGNGAAGGVGTNYVANLIIGNTWSYVTGGPEFTNQPTASTSVNVGQNVTLTGAATAAGQSVSYQWTKITGGTTNNVTNGAGGAGGSATVSGATSGSLTLTSISAGDIGNYQLVATASGTGYTLNSTIAALVLADPQITANPTNAVGNYGQTVNFNASASTTTAPLSYRWFNNGVALVNGTQPSGSVASGASGTTGAGSSFSLQLTLTGVTYQDIGSYSLTVTNTGNVANSSSAATLAVNDPIVTTPPTNPAVAAGGNASFHVVAAGTPTLGYQWYEGVTPLNDGGTTVGGSATVSGALTDTLTLTGVQDADDGNYSCQITSSVSGQSTNSAAATLTVQDPVTIVTPPVSRNERVGDHMAFSVGVAGGGPSYQWYAPNGSPILGATSSALVLTNIQTTTAGTYSVVVTNLLTGPQTASATLTVINSAILPVDATNLVVARVGDGAQALSGATGNTIYLDQYKPDGTYVSTIQVPDTSTGSPYGTGSAASVFGSPALLAQGAGADAPNGMVLALSGVNQQYLCFAGYCANYPFAGADVTVGGSAFWRGLATVNAFGVYSLAYTNLGLYSGGNHTIRGMVTSDGANFWTAGQAGSGGVKFVASTNGAYANGSGIPGIVSSATGPRVMQIVGTNLVFSDLSGAGGSGIYACSGTPEPVTGTSGSAIILSEGGQPNDFAASPDLATVYIADGQLFSATNAGASGGGVQRWDTNGVNGWSYSYTLSNSVNGAQGLSVFFPPNITTWGAGVGGAVLYATSYGPSNNVLSTIVDNGTDSAPVPIATAGPNQALRGVRFGPAVIPVSIAVQPRDQTNFPGNSVTFSVVAAGSAPFFYQWRFNGVDLPGATQSSFTTNNISFGSAGSYSVVVSNLTALTVTSSPAVLTVAGVLITPTPLPSYTETVGDHLAWAPVVTGSLPITNYWYFGSTLIQSSVIPGGGTSLSLTNIQTTDTGTYTLVVSNAFAHASASATLTVTTSRQTVSPNNLVVVRIGDGVQALSGVTGNTLYLDQYTPAGSYVNTIQVPDEGTGLPYGTGSANSASLPFGSPALIVQGAGADARFSAMLTLSPNGPNGQTLNFAGYCDGYPFTGADVSFGANGGGANANWRSIGSVDGFGYYTVAYTNTGLYSLGNHTIRSAVSADGTNFFTTGQAGSGGGIKFATSTFEPGNGGGIPSVAGSTAGTRVVQIINGNLVFSDTNSPVGLYQISGLPTGASSASSIIAEPNSPLDFAFSPDQNTVYISDNGAFGGTNVQAGGIQRWDSNGGGGYNFSYTLRTGPGSTAGARGLTVDFSAAGTWGAGITGAKLYATTAEAAANRLIKITDNGTDSTATTLVTAGPANTLAGVRFGPITTPVNIAVDPQNQTAIPGGSATFSAIANGSQPIGYRWYFQTNGVGPFGAIVGATSPTLTLNFVGSANVGNYYVIATNPVPSSAQSATASLTLASRPSFDSIMNLGPGNGFELNFSGPSGLAYTIYTSTNVALHPIPSTWTKLTTNIFSGGADSFVDPSGGTNPQQFYMISVP